MTTEIWGRMPGQTNPVIAVRFDANLVSLIVADGSRQRTVNSVLCHVPAGAKVRIKRVDTPPGFRVTVDGHTALYATDSEIWPPAPAEPVPWRVRTRGAVKSWLRTRARAAGDRVAARFGCVHEDEAGGW